jgi:hypothetical protein
MLEAIAVSAAILVGAMAAGAQSAPPEASDVLPNGVNESPAGCLEATAHTNGPCKLTYPNGNTMETRTDGTTWLTIKKLDIKFQIFSGLPVTGQFQTIIITKLPEGDIVEAPQFERMLILGNCQSKTYQIMSTATTDPNGVFDAGTDPENVMRRVLPDTPVDTVFRVFCVAPAPTKPSAEVQKLIDQEDILNDKCRDGVKNDQGVPDLKLTMKVCANRDTIFSQIEAHGWCWGHDDQPQSDRTWELCPARP